MIHFYTSSPHRFSLWLLIFNISKVLRAEEHKNYSKRRLILHLTAADIFITWIKSVSTRVSDSSSVERWTTTQRKGEEEVKKWRNVKDIVSKQEGEEILELKKGGKKEEVM